MEKVIKHRLHREVGSLLEECAEGSSCEVVLDEACGGSQHVPLFITPAVPGDHKTRKTQLCKVDALALVASKVRIVVEIEESNIKPTQVFGKLLTSALATFFSHRAQGGEHHMHERVVFIQVLKGPQTAGKSAKPAQFAYMKKAIRDQLPLGCIAEYQLVNASQTGWQDKFRRVIQAGLR